MSKVGEDFNDLQCEICNEKSATNHGIPIPRIPTGVWNGDSQRLAASILHLYYEDMKIEEHPFSTQKTFTTSPSKHPKNSGTGVKGEGRKNMPVKKFTNEMQKRLPRSAQAHHLIPCEIMRGKKGKENPWKKICKSFGYDIDHANNGVFLPKSRQIACEHKIPPHNGNHSRTVTDKVTVNYVVACRDLIKGIKDNVLRKKMCKPNEDYKTVCKKLDKKSREIWEKVKLFDWTITADGKNFKGGDINVDDMQLISKRIGKEKVIKKKIIIIDELLQTEGLGCLDFRNLGGKEKLGVLDVKKYYCNRITHGYSELDLDEALIERDKGEEERFEKN